MIKKKRPQYLVSTDSIGFFGRPDQFLKLWREDFENGTLDGVEAAALKPFGRLTKLISALKKNKIAVLSFHGKTGGENQLPFILGIFMRVVNSLVFDAETLLKHFPEIEFLSHAPYLANDSVKKVIIRLHPKKVWVENHRAGKRGVEDAIKQIKDYRKNKINAQGMLDVFHYVYPSLSTLEKDWPVIVKELESYLDFFSGIHFPIGTRMDDSLPIDKMSDSMLRLFAKKIVPRVDRVVFENQRWLPEIIFSTEKMLAGQKERNQRIIARLKKTGIII